MNCFWSITLKGKEYIIRFRWFTIKPYQNLVWSEVIFTPNTLGILMCIIGVVGAQLFTGTFPYFKKFKNVRDEFSYKSLDEILELGLSKILDLMGFLLVFGLGGYTVSRVVNFWNSLSLTKDLKYLVKSHIYWKNVSSDKALSEEERTIIKNGFLDSFYIEIKPILRRIWKFAKLMGQLLQRRLMFWGIFSIIPASIKYLTKNSTSSEILFVSAEYLTSPSISFSFVLIITSFLLSLKFKKLRDVPRLLRFLLYGWLRTLRPYLLSCTEAVLGFLLVIPFQLAGAYVAVGDKPIDKMVEGWLNGSNLTPMLESFKKLPLIIQESEFVYINPKPLEGLNAEIPLYRHILDFDETTVPDFEPEKVTNFEKRQISIEEQFNF